MGSYSSVKKVKENGKYWCLVRRALVPCQIVDSKLQVRDNFAHRLLMGESNLSRVVYRVRNLESGRVLPKLRTVEDLMKRNR